jgi:RNA polymerase sigma factor (sigma-70 family)
MKHDTQYINALVRRALQGDKQAEEELVELLLPETHQQLCKLERKYGVSADIEDLNAELWTDVLSHLHDFKTSDFLAWLARRCRWRFINHMHHINVVSRVELPIPEAECSSDQPCPTGCAAPDLEGRQFIQQVLSALDRCPPKASTAFRMVHLEDRSRHEVATVLKITPDGVDKACNRARKKLVKELPGWHLSK